MDKELLPENFRSIAKDIVNACKEQSKGKATQEVIFTILRKRAGFQSNQSLDNYVKSLKSKEPEIPAKDFLGIPTVKDVTSALTSGNMENMPTTKDVINGLKNLAKESDYKSFMTEFCASCGDKENMGERHLSSGNYISAFETLLNRSMKNYNFNLASDCEESGFYLDGTDYLVYFVTKPSADILDVYPADFNSNGVEYYLFLSKVGENPSFCNVNNLYKGTLREFSSFDQAIVYLKQLLNYTDKNYGYDLKDMLGNTVAEDEKENELFEKGGLDFPALMDYMLGDSNPFREEDSQQEDEYTLSHFQKITPEEFSTQVNLPNSKAKDLYFENLYRKKNLGSKFSTVYEKDIDSMFFSFKGEKFSIFFNTGCVKNVYNIVKNNNKLNGGFEIEDVSTLVYLIDNSKSGFKDNCLTGVINDSLVGFDDFGSALLYLKSLIKFIN